MLYSEAAVSAREASLCSVSQYSCEAVSAVRPVKLREEEVEEREWCLLVLGQEVQVQ